MPTRKPVSRGANLFGDAAPESKPAVASHRANIDGGSRGNPGPASYGVVVRGPGGEIVANLKKYIGRMTNNVAEYYGLIAALDYAQSHSIRALRIESDSELLVKQMRGQYKVKSTDLRPLYERAHKMAQAFDFFKIDHVYREQNAEADALANEAMDEAEGRPARPAAASTTKSAPSAAASKQPAAPGKRPATTPAATPRAASATASRAPAAPSGEPRRLRARHRGGVLYILEDVDLADGEVFEVFVHQIPKPPL
jgi:ribonuclease HI